MAIHMVNAQSSDLSQLEKEANQGNSKAQHDLGILYLEGKDISKDERKAFQWFEKSAKNKYGKAQYQVSFMYAEGIGVGKDLRKALEWIKKSAQQGYPLAQYDLGLMYGKGLEVGKDFRKMFEWMKKSAQQGYPPAQYHLGAMYRGGIGTTKNEANAIEWYKKCEHDQVQAQYDLGIIYWNRKNYSASFKWFLKAARNGDKDAQVALAFQYQVGDGTLKNPWEAFYWYRKSAEQGHKEAQLVLGQLYYLGKGITADEERAAYWIAESYKNGNKDAKKVWDELELWKHTDAVKRIAEKERKRRAYERRKAEEKRKEKEAAERRRKEEEKRKEREAERIKKFLAERRYKTYAFQRTEPATFDKMKQRFKSMFSQKDFYDNSTKLEAKFTIQVHFDTTGTQNIQLKSSPNLPDELIKKIKQVSFAPLQINGYYVKSTDIFDYHITLEKRKIKVKKKRSGRIKMKGDYRRKSEEQIKRYLYGKDNGRYVFEEQYLRINNWDKNEIEQISYKASFNTGILFYLVGGLAAVTYWLNPTLFD